MTKTETQITTHKAALALLEKMAGELTLATNNASASTIEHAALLKVACAVQDSTEYLKRLGAPAEYEPRFELKHDAGGVAIIRKSDGESVYIQGEQANVVLGIIAIAAESITTRRRFTDYDAAADYVVADYFD